MTCNRPYGSPRPWRIVLAAFVVLAVIALAILLVEAL